MNVPARSFRSRLLLVFAAGFGVLFLIGAYGLVVQRQTLERISAHERTDAARLLLLKEIELDYAHQRLTWAGILARGDDLGEYHAALSAFYESERRTLQGAEALMREVAADAVLHEPTRQFVRRLYELRAGHRQALRIYNASTAVETSASRFLAAINQEPTEALARLQHTLLREHEATLQQLSQRTRRQETSILLGALSALMLVSLFVLWFVDRNFATPMTQAIETAKQVAAGKVDERFHSHPSGEFGAFAEAFNFMLDRLARANSELQYANRELEAFSYSVSHDLRAPLRAVDGFTQALAEDCGDTLDVTGRDYLARVRNGAQNMERLIDDLLKLSLITRASLQPADVNLTSMAREVAANLRNSEPHRDVRIDIAEGLRCQGDPGLMRIVLENLLGNAWKYTSKTPQACITFDTESGAAETVYRVRDNGAGFEMKFAGKLFGAFQRLHQKAEFEGSGIGLATVARIVYRHRGRVWAEAEPGKGACISFTLGAAAPAS